MLMLYEEEIVVVTRIVASESRNKEREERERNEEANTANYFSTDSAR